MVYTAPTYACMDMSYNVSTRSVICNNDCIFSQPFDVLSIGSMYRQYNRFWLDARVYLHHARYPFDRWMLLYHLSRHIPKRINNPVDI